MQIFNYVKAFGKTSVDLLAAVDGIVDWSMPMTRSSIAPCLTTAQLSNHKYLLRQFPTRVGLHAGLLRRPEKDEAKAESEARKCEVEAEIKHFP